MEWIGTTAAHSVIQAVNVNVPEAIGFPCDCLSRLISGRWSMPATLLMANACGGGVFTYGSGPIAVLHFRYVLSVSMNYLVPGCTSC